MISVPFRMTIKLNKLVSKQKEIIKRRAKNKWNRKQKSHREPINPKPILEKVRWPISSQSDREGRRADKWWVSGMRVGGIPTRQADSERTVRNATSNFPRHLRRLRWNGCLKNTHAAGARGRTGRRRVCSGGKPEGSCKEAAGTNRRARDRNTRRVTGERDRIPTH